MRHHSAIGIFFIYEETYTVPETILKYNTTARHYIRNRNMVDKKKRNRNMFKYEVY